MTQLTEHFSLEELTNSDTAIRLGINNIPTQDMIKENLQRVAELLEEVRALLGAPLHINSGYRSPQLNAKIGGAKSSAHMSGRAADFVCPQFGVPIQIARRIADSKIDFDKLIQEGTWIHIAVPEKGVAAKRQILTAHFVGGKASYTEGLK